MNCVLDSSAMLAVLKGETGGELVENLLDDNTISVYAHVMNLTEVFYDFSRRTDVLNARNAIADLKSYGLLVRDDNDTAFWEDAAQLKADWRRVSLADCFGVALARRLSADFVTSDRHELEIFDQNGIAQFNFIR